MLAKKVVPNYILTLYAYEINEGHATKNDVVNCQSRMK